MLAAVYMALCLAPSPAPEPEPSDPPRAAFVGGAGGTQALGFKPFPANPTASIFGDVRWIERRYYGLHTTLALGYAGQVGFLHAGFMDAVLSQRWTAPFGLYGGVDLIVGGQLGFVPGAQYAIHAGGRPERVRPRPHGSARFGLGLELGVDTTSRMSRPIRAFVRYRQLALGPFMLGNGVPVMGVATLTAGVAVQIGVNP